MDSDSWVRVSRVKTELASTGDANLRGDESVRPRIASELLDSETVNYSLRHRIAHLRVFRESLK